MSYLSTAAAFIIGLAIIGAATALAWHGTFDQATVSGMFYALIGGGVGGVVGHAVGSKKP